MKLENRVAIITRGGQEISKAVALAFATERAHLLLASRTVSQVEVTGLEAWYSRR